MAENFKQKYEIEAKKYLNKNVTVLMESKPGQAYTVLKRMGLGAQPGDCIDSNTFPLPSHERESLSEEQSAERIANYFAQISQEYPPLDTKLLPQHVQVKLDSESIPPVITEYEVYQKTCSAKKPSTR